MAGQLPIIRRHIRRIRSAGVQGRSLLPGVWGYPPVLHLPGRVGKRTYLSRRGGEGLLPREAQGGRR